MTMRFMLRAAIAGAVLLAAVSCNNEINKDTSPILLVMNVTQNVNRWDIATTCDKNVADILLEARAKNPSLNTQFLDTRITSYRVTWRRADGGTVAPPVYTRAMDLLLTPGSTGASGFFHFDDFGGSFTQAPFAALLPQNGGVDAETKSKNIKFNIQLEVFGQTLAGDRVYSTTTLPLDFCYSCGGCAL